MSGKGFYDAEDKSLVAVLSKGELQAAMGGQA